MSRTATDLDSLIQASLARAGGGGASLDDLIAQSLARAAAPTTAPAVPAGMAYGGYLPGQVAPRDAYAAAQLPTVSLMPGGDGQIANIVRGLDRGVNVAGTQIGGAMAAAGNFLPGSVGRQLVTQGEDYAAQQAMMRDQTAPTTTFLGGVAEAVPGLVGAIGTGLATGGVAPALGLGAGLVGTAAGATVAGVQSGGGQYVDAMERLQNRGIVGDTARDKAAASAAGTGAVSAVTSVIPMGRYLSRLIPATVASGVMGRIATTRAGRIVIDAAAEGSQEAVEELGSMVAQSLAENDPEAYQQFMPRIAQAFGAGAVLGGVVGGAMDVATGGGPEERARQAAAMRESQSRNEAADKSQIGSKAADGPEVGQSSPVAGAATPDVATATPDVAPDAITLTPEAAARVDEILATLGNNPDMPDAEAAGLLAELATLRGDIEYANDAPGTVEPAPAPVAAVAPDAVAGVGSVAAPSVGTAADGQLSGVGEQLGSGNGRVGRVDNNGRVLAPDVSNGLVSGGVDANANAVAGSGGMLPERAAAVTGTNNLTRKEVPNGEERQGRQEVLNPAARSSDTRPLAIADMNEAQLRARAAELGLNSKGAIGAVRRRIEISSRQRQSSAGSRPASTVESQSASLPSIPAPGTSQAQSLDQAGSGVSLEQSAGRTFDTPLKGDLSSSPNPTPTLPSPTFKNQADQERYNALIAKGRARGRQISISYDKAKGRMTLTVPGRGSYDNENYEFELSGYDGPKFYYERGDKGPALPSSVTTPTAAAASPAAVAPAQPTPAQVPLPAPAQSPATSPQSRTQGESATAATGTATAGRALDEQDTDPELRRVSRQLNAPIRAVEPQTPRQKQLVERLGKLGTRVVIVDDPTQSFKGFAGNSRERRSVYIASDIDDAKLASVFSHEVFHSLVRQNPDFRDEVASILGEERVARGERDYRAELEASSLGGGSVLEAFDKDADLRREEGVAKVLEDAAAGDAEAARLLYETPGLIQRLRQAIRRVLADMGVKLASPEHRALMRVLDEIGVAGKKASESKRMGTADTPVMFSPNDRGVGEFRNDPEKYARSLLADIPRGKPGVSSATFEGGQPGYVYRDESGKAVGVVKYDSRAITDIAVAKGVRGQGIARQLVEATGLRTVRGPFTPASRAMNERLGLVEEQATRFAPRGMARIEQRNQERADKAISRLEKKVESEQTKAANAKAEARQTIATLRATLGASLRREKGLGRVVVALDALARSQTQRADDATAEAAARKEAMKAMTASRKAVERVKAELTRAVRDALPRTEHGRFITDIAKVTSEGQLVPLLAKVEKAAQEYRARELDARLARLTGIRDTRKLDDAKVRDMVVGARTGRGKLKMLTEADGTRDTARRAMRDFVDSAKAFMDATTNDERAQRIAELETALTTLTAAVEQQKAADKLIAKGRMQVLSDVAKQVAERLGSQPVRTISRRLGQTFGSAGYRAMLTIAGLDNIANMVDGRLTDGEGGGGAFQSIIAQPIREGQDAHAAQVEDAKDAADAAARANGLGSFAEAFAKLFGAMGEANVITYKLTQPIGGRSELPAHAALKLAAMDPETLSQVLGKDRPLYWDENGEPFTVSWQQYDALMKVIPENHLAFVNDLKRIRDAGFGDMATVVKTLTGTEPPKVLGYDKITVHPDVAARWRAADTASLAPTGHVAASLENLGITKARESRSAAMLVTNFGTDWLQTVDTQARITHLATPIRNMKMLIAREDVVSAIRSRISPYALTRLGAIADDVSGTGTRGAREGGEFTRRWLKYSANKGKALTALNLGSILRNGAGLMALSAEMDGRSLVDGMSRVMTMRGDSLAALMEKSPTVRRMYGRSIVALTSIQTQGASAADAGADRAGSMWEQFVRGGKATGKSLAAAGGSARRVFVNRGQRAGAARDFMRDLLDAAANAGTMTDGIQFMQYVASLPARVAWEGYKAEAARTGKDEAWAIAQTEKALRRTQGVPDPAEFTALQSWARGTMAQPFTMFGTDAARMSNILLRAAMTGQGRRKAVVAASLVGLWSGAVTMLMSKELLQSLFGTGDEEDRQRMWIKGGMDALRDSFGGVVPGISDRAVEAVKAGLTVRTPGAAVDAVVENPASSGVANVLDAMTRGVSAIDEGISGDDGKGDTATVKGLKSLERIFTEILEAGGSPLPAVYRQGKRVVTAMEE